MSEDPEKAKRDASNKLLGRAVVIGFLVLVAVYALATFVR